MTTIACNRHEMAADTRVTWEGVGTDVYTARKLYVGRNAIYGVTGDDCSGAIRAIEWLKGDRNPEQKPLPPEYEHSWDWKIIELSADGIAIYNELLEREVTDEDVLAVGSGRKVALYCMKHASPRLSPAEAVRAACLVDHYSSVPIYRARLDALKVERWKPEPKPRAPKALRAVPPPKAPA